MDEKTIEAQQVTEEQIADEQLGSVAGGMRDDVRLETRTRETVEADDEGEDRQPIPFVKCPMCGRPFLFCTCYF